MVFRRFPVRLAARLIVIAAVAAGVFWLLSKPGFHSSSLLSAALLVLLIAELWWFVTRTNREIARFLAAARHADYSQRFSLHDLGAGFGELADAFTDILNRMHEARETDITESRRLRALIEHIPVPLMTVHDTDAIELQNNAARRLFGASQVTRLADLRQFGGRFHDALCEAVPGRRELVTFAVEGIEYQLTLATTEIVIDGNAQRLVSLQDIQSELDDNEARAWQDLVLVLTHEIMNSITPVTSLATTANKIVDDVVARHAAGESIAEDLTDLREAVSTVAKRSDSLTQFVHSYRQLTRLAPPEKKRLSLTDLFSSTLLLAKAEWPDSESWLKSSISPSSLDVYCDQDLLEPVLLNLLRNARQATADTRQPQVALNGRLNRRGNVVVEISDNGPGVDDDIAHKVFVPFFTTKEGGSGVGLALARQVMTAHGGFLRLSRSDSGGAAFTLTF